MRITKEDIDTPFCDLIEGATNPETPREFIRDSEEEFGFGKKDINNMSEDELNVYIDQLEVLWGK